LNRPRMSLAVAEVDGDKDDFGFGEADGFAFALGLDGNVNGDRRGANADNARQKADDVADEHGPVKFDGVHSDRNQRLARPALFFEFVQRADHAGLVDVAEQDAAKDGAEWVGVVRHHDGLEGQMRISWKGWHTTYGVMKLC